MDKREIVMQIGREGRVERMVQNIARASRLSPDLKDLCQMVYLAVLTYDDDKVIDLWEHDEIDFFLARIILNQYRSSDSAFRDIFRRYSITHQPLEGHDFPDQ